MEQDTIRKERVDEKVTELDFKAGNSEEYKVEAIWDSAVYARDLEGHLPGLYYLVAWKGYTKEENTWEPVSAIQHLRKQISLFHKDSLEKRTATSSPVNSASPRARPTVKPVRPIAKRKQGQPANNANKRAKKNKTFCSFTHVTFPWPIGSLVCSVFIKKLYQMIFLIVNFPFWVPNGLGGFFIDNIFRLFPQLSYRARRFFCTNWATDVPPLTPIGLGGFLPSCD